MKRANSEGRIHRYHVLREAISSHGSEARSKSACVVRCSPNFRGHSPSAITPAGVAFSNKAPISRTPVHQDFFPEISSQDRVDFGVTHWIGYKSVDVWNDLRAGPDGVLDVEEEMGLHRRAEAIISTCIWFVS